MTETRPRKTLLDRLKPYEKLILRLEEIFLLKRPLVFGLILLIVLGTAISIKSYECGVFATIFLISIVLYGTSILWVYFGSYLEPKLFPELPQEKLDQGAKFYTLEQLVEIIKAHKKKKGSKAEPQSTSKYAIYAGVCFVLAFVLNFISEFYVTLALAILLLFTPFLLSQPAVLKFIHKGNTPSIAQN